MKKLLLITWGLTVAITAVHAQKYPERKDIRIGNKLYHSESFPEAELSYLKALQSNPQSVEATGNLAGAMYKQGRFEEAAALSAKVARDSTAGEFSSQLFYNEGNAHFQQRKLDEAIEAYKNTLRRNPDDEEAKFNLAYALLLKQQNDGGEGGQDDKQNDQNDKQDQNKDQNKDQDQGEPDQNQSKNQGGEGKQPTPQGGISPQQAEQMLDAMQGAEDNTKQKVDAQKAKAASRSGKNW